MFYRHLLTFHFVDQNRQIKEEKTIEGWFPLGSYSNVPGEDEDAEEGDEPADGNRGEIHIEINYTPIEETCLADTEVALPNAYYEPREGCKVTLFQNAEVSPLSIPDIPFNPEYQHGRCWVEIARAIMSATKFIYITGWAVYSEIVLVRTEDDEFCGMTLGEMLKQKAEEGVTVRILVWDELASNMFSAGLMGTHVSSAFFLSMF